MATYAPEIDFEIWNGNQELAWCPDVLLEVMRSQLLVMGVDFNSWLTN